MSCIGLSLRNKMRQESAESNIQIDWFPGKRISADVSKVLSGEIEYRSAEKVENRVLCYCYC